jgi:signal transduction histidine kinase
MVSAPQDPKGRLVSIFVGAVLLPSVALSVVSFHAIPKQAEATKIQLYKRAEKVLYYIEEDLKRAARARALDAARVVGAERLLQGHADAIQAALRKGGFEADTFETLRLEGHSPVAKLSEALVRDHDVEGLKEAWIVSDLGGAGNGDEAVVLSGHDSSVEGVLRYRYSCQFVHGRLLRDYFEKEFGGGDQSIVIRVSEPDGAVVYETASTTSDKPFEVKRVMAAPSYKGLKLQLRYRERSIEDEVRRWAVAKTILIAFIDLMLGAGLYLVYSNVRREARLARLKSDFVANVSHELKTPLALIRLFAETLELGRVGSPGKAQEYYRVINKESQRLTQLIDNVLDFSRIEAGRKEYRFEPTDVARVVEEVLDAYRFSLDQHGFKVDVQVADDLPVVQADRAALTQALVNLVTNAIKYSKDEKWVAILARRDGDRVVISVADRGIGIPRGEQSKIFEKFFRGEASLVHETKGSGLGLSLVRHIMEAHGGGVELESAPGRGSSFSLVLPVRDPFPNGVASPSLGTVGVEGAMKKADA